MTRSRKVPRTTWHRSRRFLHMTIVAGLLVALSACTVPEHMRVRSGMEPRHQDDDVRFRTVYYFRVFDACFDIAKYKDDYENPKGKGYPFHIKTKGAYRILSDSLYRFRMTGKANPLFSSVHFEAGTLKASEIDPFGANVEYDSDARRYRYVSADETAKRAEHKAIYEELMRLDTYAAKLKVGDKASDVEKAAVEKQKAGIENRIEELWKRLTALDNGLSIPATPGGEGDKNECPSDTAARRGFQVLGPEGFRTFNQDERLLLAMSISGKPLISALKELSNRVLNERSSSDGTLLRLAQERVRTSEAKLALERAANDPALSPEQIADRVRKAFSPQEDKQ